MNKLKQISVAILLLLGIPAKSYAQEWAVSTNLAGYLNLGTLNIEASYAPLRHVSFDISAKYNPFTYHTRNGSQFQNRQRTCAVGIRLWPWHVMSGWWVATRVQYQEYNQGGILKSRTEEGDKVGLSVAAGYTLMLHKNINMEFGLGGWAGYKWYTVYACPKCGVTLDKGAKAFILPNDLVVSIAYVF